MARKGKAGNKSGDDVDLGRRSFFTQGAAAGVMGAAAIASVGAAEAAETPKESWDYDVDIVVIGSGATGLPAAVRARDLGASVLVIEQNYDVGGKLAHNGGLASMGGGDPIQERDRLGLDPENLGLGKPVVPTEDLTDDPETLFRDITDWSVVDAAGVADYRYNDPAIHKTWAYNTPKVRQFFSDNYIRFSRITQNNLGNGVPKARGAWAIMKLSDKTDIEAGTVTKEDAGDGDNEKSSAFNPMYWPPAPSASAFGAPGYVYGGWVIARSLEYSARKKGVQFLLNRHMDEIVREPGPDGRVIGVVASYSPRLNPQTGEVIPSWWSNGNVDDKKDVVRIRARKAVIVGAGGWMGNPNFRSMFDPRLREPSFQYNIAVLGERHADASGIMAGMKVGAGLAGLLQPFQHPLGSPKVNFRVGTPSMWDATFPGNPAFLFVRSAGVNVDPEWVIAVNQVGQRIYNESSLAADETFDATYPPGTSGTNKPFTALDWHNASVEHVKGAYDYSGLHAAALSMNEGSVGPNYTSGPIWAIFDQAAVDANGWEIRAPYVADPPDGFFFKADSIAELARMVMQNKFQHMPLNHLEDTVTKFNADADAGKDSQFEKPKMHKIEKGPFYAGLIPVNHIDSYGGLRIDGNCQVLDLDGNTIAGLYAGGESSGGGRQHGIGRACVHGYMAATHAMGIPV